MDKKGYELKQRKEGYIGWFGGKKEKEEKDEITSQK